MMMSFTDRSTALLATCGGDCVKLFEVPEDTGSDPCMLSYSPSPGFQVNSLKWNHTNLVVASAGDDKKISLWRKNGQSMGTVPISGSDVGDNIDVLRVLDYSRISPHLLVTAGDNGSVHLWDTTGRSPKVSWLKQHSAPTTGVCFSPSNDKDDAQSTLSQPSAASASSLKSEQSFSAPPEAWGGEALSDKFSHHHQPSRFMPTSGSLTSGALMSSSTFAGLQESSSLTSLISISSLTNTSLITSLHGKDISHREAISGFSEPSTSFPFSSIASSLGIKTSAGQANLNFPGSMSMTIPRRFSTYAERISTISSFSDGASPGMGSPKLKKSGAETRDELANTLSSRSDTSAAAGMGVLPTTNGVTLQPQKGLAQPDQKQGASSFTLQLVQRTLEETLTSVQKSVHEDMRNLHIELLRQLHIQETEMSSVLNSVLEKQAELMKKVQSLRKEHQ